MQSKTRIQTQSASRYLQQLCKHWSHKFDVEFTPERGRVPFADDRACTFEAEGETLTMTVEAPDEAAIDRLEGVVTEHLKRFAFREELGEIAWQRAG